MKIENEEETLPERFEYERERRKMEGKLREERSEKLKERER